jgi:hypothetical protein
VYGIASTAFIRLLKIFDVEGQPSVSIISHKNANRLDGPKIHQKISAPYRI